MNKDLADVYIEEAIRVVKKKYKDDEKAEGIINEKVLPILMHIIGSEKTLDDIAPLEYFIKEK